MCFVTRILFRFRDKDFELNFLWRQLMRDYWVGLSIIHLVKYINNKDMFVDIKILID